MRCLYGYVCACLFFTTLATADERDQLFFGSPGDDVEETSPQTKPTEEPTPPSKHNPPASDPTLGGQLFFQNNAVWLKETDPADGQLDSQALLFLYLDSRSSEDTRVFARASLLSPLGSSDERSSSIGGLAQRRPARLEQLWLKTNYKHTVFLTLGLQPIRWGVGRIWNPSDFLNDRQRDPVAVFDDRPGVPGLKLHFPVERFRQNLYLIIRQAQGQKISALRYALRFEQLIGQAEWTASMDWGFHQSLKLATDLSFALGPIDVRTELSAHSTPPIRRWRGTLDFETAELPVEARPKRFAPQWVVGIEYPIRLTDEHTLFITTEYFRNEWGYAEGTDLYPWIFAMGDYRPLYLGRDYFAYNLALPSLMRNPNLTLAFTQLFNLNDRSMFYRTDLTLSLTDTLSLNAFFTLFGGRRGEFNYDLTVPAGLVTDEPFEVPVIKIFSGIWLNARF